MVNPEALHLLNYLLSLLKYLLPALPRGERTQNTAKM